MEQRYWLELTEQERHSIEEEWLKTNWYNNIVKEEKDPYSYILSGMCLLWGIVLIILATGELSEDSSVIYAFLGGIALIILFVYFLLRPKISKEHKVDKEFSKWLLKKHNIIK
ncbi:MAG: hypothetical protein E7172_03485 [Firmicutes bacterium]|nr:hypothetical protein [Bacillota bacterium]